MLLYPYLCMEHIHNWCKPGEITIFIIQSCWETSITFLLRTEKSLHCIIEFQCSSGLSSKAEGFLILHTPRNLVFEQFVFSIRIDTNKANNRGSSLCFSYLFDILEMIRVPSLTASSDKFIVLDIPWNYFIMQEISLRPSTVISDYNPSTPVLERLRSEDRHKIKTSLSEFQIILCWSSETPDQNQERQVYCMYDMVAFFLSCLLNSKDMQCVSWIYLHFLSSFLLRTKGKTHLIKLWKNK